MIKTCIHCDMDFNLHSRHKRQAGGKVNECPDCVIELGTERAVKYLGLQAGDGKSAGISIVAFESDEDRSAYASAWRANTGHNGGYGGHLSSSNPSIGGRPMRHVGYNAGNSNHKGKQ